MCPAHSFPVSGTGGGSTTRPASTARSTIHSRGRIERGLSTAGAAVPPPPTFWWSPTNQRCSTRVGWSGIGMGTLVQADVVVQTGAQEAALQAIEGARSDAFDVVDRLGHSPD